MNLIKDILRAIRNECAATETCTACPFNISNSYHDYCFFGGENVFEGVTPDVWELEKIKIDEGGVHGQ